MVLFLRCPNLGSIHGQISFTENSLHCRVCEGSVKVGDDTRVEDENELLQYAGYNDGMSETVEKNGGGESTRWSSATQQ